MGRGSVFPGVSVRKLKVSSGPHSVEKQYNIPIVGKSFEPGKRLRPLIHKLKNKVGVETRPSIEYTLEVKGVSEASAASKARAFTRIKNVFEPTVVEVEYTKWSSGSGLVKTFTIRTKVEK